MILLRKFSDFRQAFHNDTDPIPAIWLFPPGLFASRCFRADFRIAKTYRAHRLPRVMKLKTIRAFMRFGKSCWKRSLARTRNFFSPLWIQTSKSLSAARKAFKPSGKSGSRKMSIVRSGTRWRSCFGWAGRSENRRTNFGRRMFQPVSGQVWRLRFFSDHCERRKGEERAKRQVSHDYISILRYCLEPFRQRFTRAEKQDGPCMGSHSSSRGSGGFC